MKNFFIRQSRNICYLLTGFLATLIVLRMQHFVDGYNTIFTLIEGYKWNLLHNLLFLFPLLLSFSIKYFIKNRRVLEIFETILILISFVSFIIYKNPYSNNIIDSISNIFIYLTTICLLTTKFINFIFVCNISNDVMLTSDLYLKKKNKKTNFILITLSILFLCYDISFKMMDSFFSEHELVKGNSLFIWLIVLTIGSLVVINLLPERVKINTIVLAGYIVISLVLSLISFDYERIYYALSYPKSGSIFVLILLILIIIFEIALILNNLDLMKKYCAIIDEMDKDSKISDVKSSFDGKLIQLIGWYVLGYLLTIISAGIAYPTTLCFIERWKCKHSVISGRRLTFDGKAIQLIGKWCLWLLLSIVTFGVYAWFIPIKLEKWKTSHTHFIDEPEGTRKSDFDGKLIQLIGLNMLSIFVTIITFGLAYPSILCWKEKWLWKHKEIDGTRFVFDGKGIQLIGKWMCWIALCMVTFYIFAWFIPIKIYKWRLSHTHLIIKGNIVIETEEL